MDSFTARPTRMSLVRMDDPSYTLYAQANPPDFAERYGAEWSKQKVPGLSHSIKQFASTLDTELTLSLQFMTVNHGQKGYEELRKARRFLKSACRPLDAPGTITAAGAPRLLFLWPNFFSMVCILVSVDFSYKQFNAQARPMHMVAQVKLEELRSELITANEIDDGEIDAFLQTEEDTK